MSRNSFATGAGAALALALAGAGFAAQAQTTMPPPVAVTTAPPASAARFDPLNRRDRNFIEEAAQGGMAEIEHAKLAAQRASHPQVKQFAQRMVADHTQAGDELKTIAGARGVTPPLTIDRKQQREKDKLGKLSGNAFDREYMKHMVDAHKRTVSLFEKQAKSGKDGDLKSFAIKTLPTLKEHLALASSTHDAVEGAH